MNDNKFKFFRIGDVLSRWDKDNGVQLVYSKRLPLKQFLKDLVDLENIFIYVYQEFKLRSLSQRGKRKFLAIKNGTGLIRQKVNSVPYKLRDSLFSKGVWSEVEKL